MRSWIVAAGVVFALAGCSDVPRSHAYRLFSDKLDEGSQYAAYRDDLDSDDIALLDGKINFKETYHRETPACRHIEAANEYPTPAESAALRRWAAVRAAFFEQFYSLELKTVAPSDKVLPLAQLYVAALEDDLDYSTALIDDLAAGKMTYCQFAERQKEAILASHDRVTPLRKEMQAAMKDDHYFDGTGIGTGGPVAGGGSSGPANAVR